MPCNVIEGLVNFLAASSRLNANVWDGEVPRYDTVGNAISPDSPAAADWPVVKLYMDEGGLEVEWTTEDACTETGAIIVKVWATTRDAAEALVIAIWGLLASATSWTVIDYGGNPSNLNYQIQMLLERWTCVQEEGARTEKSELLYRGEMHYKCQIHTAISTA